MTLVFVLITLAIDLISIDLERFRKFNWFISLYHLSDRRFMNNKYWDGNFGLLGLLAVPILSLSLIIFILGYWSSFAEAILVISILIYCISPKKLLSQFDKYIISIEKEEADASVLAQQLINKEITNNSDDVEVAIMKSFFVGAHKQILAAIFWYFMLH